MTEFKPKGEDVLRQETINSYGFDENDETHQPIIEKIVSDRLKDEKMKASLHDQKLKAKKEAEDYKKAKDFYKTGGQSKGTQTSNEDEKQNENKERETRQIIAEEMFLSNGGSNTDLRQLKKIMTATGKDFREAQKDSLFIAFREKQEREGISRSSQLPPSRGGSISGKTTEADKIAEKNTGNLPPGFSVPSKK